MRNDLPVTGLGLVTEASKGFRQSFGAEATLVTAIWCAECVRATWRAVAAAAGPRQPPPPPRGGPARSPRGYQRLLRIVPAHAHPSTYSSLHAEFPSGKLSGHYTSNVKYSSGLNFSLTISL